MDRSPHNNSSIETKDKHKLFSPEGVRKNFESKRIQQDTSFEGLYSTFHDDIQRVARISNVFKNEKNKDEMGPLGEALVFTCIEQGALGQQITARGTAEYDDFFHGADLVIESKAKQQRDPIVSSIDVTVAQQALGFNGGGKFEMEGAVYEIGLEKKLDRVKRHIQQIANYPRERAVEMSAWLQSGGLSQPRTNANKGIFEEAERLMLLKYYKNPETSEDPNKPHFVMAGPQIVVSVDRSFVNKAFSGSSSNEKAIQDINNLIQVEVPFSVAMTNAYIEAMAKDLTKRNQTPNLFFDMLRASCRAWELTFSTDQNDFRLQRALQYCLKDPELKKQVMYYQETIKNSFLGGEKRK